MDASNFPTLFLLCLALSATITALTPAEQEGFLTFHNRLREQIGSPALTWDPALSEKAHTCAEKQNRPGCEDIPTTMPPEENMFHGAKSDCETEITVCGHSLDWEATVYDPFNQSCPDVIPCDRFARMASPVTLRVGCSYAPCADGGLTLVCMYDPPHPNVTTRYQHTTQY